MYGEFYGVVREATLGVPVDDQFHDSFGLLCSRTKIIRSQPLSLGRARTYRATFIRPTDISPSLRHSFLVVQKKTFSLRHTHTHLIIHTTFYTFRLDHSPTSMYLPRVPTKLPLSKQTAAQLSKAVASYGVSTGTPGLRLTGLHIQSIQSSRQFSSTSRTRLRDYFPEAEHEHRIQKTEPAWPHPP